MDKKQSTWAVPEKDLRDRVCQQIVQAVVPVYRKLYAELWAVGWERCEFEQVCEIHSGGFGCSALFTCLSLWGMGVLKEHRLVRNLRMRLTLDVLLPLLSDWRRHVLLWSYCVCSSSVEKQMYSFYTYINTVKSGIAFLVIWSKSL